MDKDYTGFKVAACARTYYDSRRTDEPDDGSKVVWNYNTAGIFDSKKGFRLRGIPELSATPQKEKRLGEVKGNLIDCSTFAGLVLRGIDYAHSPYALNSGDTWNPSDAKTGIRALTENYGSEWKNTELDCQPVGFSDIGYSGSSTIRSAADLADYYFKHGEIIYDSERDGEVKKVTENNAVIGFAANSGENIMEKLLPGDLLFWSKYGWHMNDKNVELSNFGITLDSGKPAAGDKLTVFVEDEKISCKIESDSSLEFSINNDTFLSLRPIDGSYTFVYDFKRLNRYRAISHIAIASENTQYYYEATTLKYTLYRRNFLPTELTPNGTFLDLCLVIRPKY